MIANDHCRPNHMATAMRCQTQCCCMPEFWMLLIFTTWRIIFFPIFWRANNLKVSTHICSYIFVDRPSAVKWLFIVVFYFVFLFFSCRSLRLNAFIRFRRCARHNDRHRLAQEWTENNNFGNEYIRNADNVWEAARFGSMYDKWTATMSLRRFSIHGTHRKFESI